MTEILSLNELYAQFCTGILEREKLETLIYEIILKKLHQFNKFRWGGYECTDFLAWLYPRLSRAVDSYRETGASFATYVESMVKWGIREYRARLADNKVAEYTAWTIRIPDLFTAEIDPDYIEADPNAVEIYEQIDAPGDDAAGVKPAKNRRQLLFLILKCYYCVSDDFLDRAAPRVGIKKETLKNLIEKIRRLRMKRDDELRGMRERIYCQFYRCIVYEKRLAALPENSGAAYKMRKRLERARLRLVTMRERYSKIRPNATNSQIAEVLGIAKGTVDSSLFVLKRKTE
jgi:hypothetical protein